jgi:hypothetical protein
MHIFKLHAFGGRYILCLWSDVFSWRPEAYFP